MVMCPMSSQYTPFVPVLSDETSSLPVEWEVRTASITNWRTGEESFRQENVEVPSFWSLNATNILASKYFRGGLTDRNREFSLRQVVDRIVGTIAKWGSADGYFAGDDKQVFIDELSHLLIHQEAAFNSPVWFNIGVKGVPQQASACFILSVDDTIDSILEWYREEAVIFKGGSGAGVNLSNIRGSVERLRGGGSASGPVSFMRGADASAGAIKSGGATRRAAKMVLLNADHPDIEEFIACKMLEERKARVLREAGFDMDLDGADSFSVQYQNANNSVRVTDAFMNAVLNDDDWDLKSVKTGETVKTVKARSLMRRIAEAAWECADPGVQFDTTINKWHTSSVTGRINASNPCAEYVHLDNSACNLASLNLLCFVNPDGSFDLNRFGAAVRVLITAQDILVGRADYPTKRIGETTRQFRQLGLGYANLGALLMSAGVPYDSEQGRAYAAAITAYMTGEAYKTSCRLADQLGAHEGYVENRAPMLNVLALHEQAVHGIKRTEQNSAVLDAAHKVWDETVSFAAVSGVRNAQVTVLAPTGTIGLLMDCDTTGIEPDLGLIKQKKLVGGGSMRIVNHTVQAALQGLGYDSSAAGTIMAHIEAHGSVLTAPGLAAEHVPVFACAMGDNPIHYNGHIKMMAAVQPFLSGAISKCVTGDTLVPSSEGLVPLRTLAMPDAAADSFEDKIVEVVSLGDLEKTSAVYTGGLRETRGITLRNGFRVVGTLNHRVLTVSESGLDWVALSDLSVGDYVGVQIGGDMWSSSAAWLGDFTPSPSATNQKQVSLPEYMTTELAFFLGAYAAEGNITSTNWTVSITNPELAVLERCSEAIRAVFGFTPKITYQEGKCLSLKISSKTVVEFLDYLAVGKGSANKVIPEMVLRSPKECVLAFMQGLALDSYIAQNKWAICLKSNLLLDQVQVVLANLGVLTGRVSKYNKEYDHYYDEVYASGSHAVRFVELCPPMEPHKQAAATLLHSTQNSAWDIVPGITGPELFAMLPERPGISQKWRFLKDSRTKAITRDKVVQLLDVEGVTAPSWLRSALQSGVHFVPVSDVADTGLQEVYDLVVPHTQAFAANGIMNHNTVNLPASTTVEEIEHVYVEAWKLGLKSVAVYRDNSKVGQPLTVQTTPETVVQVESDVPVVPVVVPVTAAAVPGARQRRSLPRRRRSTTYSFRVDSCHGHFTVGEFDDGSPAELFIGVSKQGSTLAGIMNTFGISISLGLQYGVPLEVYCQYYTNMKFEPSGMTSDPDLRIASSLVDYIFRRIAMDYLPLNERRDLGILSSAERTEDLNYYGDVEDTAPVVEVRAEPRPTPTVTNEAPLCYGCGNETQRAGSCWACPACGSTTGCS